MGTGRQPTGRNQTQLRSQRLQHHDDLWLQNPTTPDDGHSNHPQTGKRHTHPQPAQQPLMLVNNQKSGHLGQGCDKYCTQKFCLNTNPKNQHFATTTLKLGLAKCSVSISYVCRHPLGPRHPSPAQQDRATKYENQQLRHVKHIRDQSV